MITRSRLSNPRGPATARRGRSHGSHPHTQRPKPPAPGHRAPQPPAHSPTTLPPADTWLLLTTAHSTDADGLPAQLSRELERLGKRSTIIGGAALIRRLTGAAHVVAILPPPPHTHPNPAQAHPTPSTVRWLTRLSRRLPDRHTRPPRLYVLTRYLQPTPTNTTTSPEHAAITRLLRTLTARHPQLRPVHINTSPATHPAAIARQLLDTPPARDTTYQARPPPPHHVTPPRTRHALCEQQPATPQGGKQ
ncbi:MULTISPECIES: hypothetical protein [unclassified Streptomyces]|uniref:hypothetical protein n=1 Tax=unclassified Streptomyces TaxID=2593676 RepID=UPI0033E6654B